MRRTGQIALVLLFLAGSAAGQTNPTDSQTLEAILAQIRQLRQDLRTTSVASQRAQILIFRLQGEEATVRRLQDRVDSARSRLSQAQQQEKNLSNRAKEIEDSLSNTDDPKVRKELEGSAAQIKRALDMQANSEQETQTQLTESEDQLRLEQAKLGRLQDELERLDKALQESTRVTAAPQ